LLVSPESSAVPSLKEVNQKIVRLNANSGDELIANDELLLELAEQFISKDTPLAIAYLLSLSQVHLLSLVLTFSSRYTLSNSSKT
jgi:hypothetical protein